MKKLQVNRATEESEYKKRSLNFALKVSVLKNMYIKMGIIKARGKLDFNNREFKQPPLCLQIETSPTH